MKTSSLSRITRWLRDIPIGTSRLPAGFPSPADDYPEPALNLHALLVPRPGATFFMRAEGVSLPGSGILAGDLLVVDRSLAARPGRIVVAVVDGALHLRRWGHSASAPALAEAADESALWGVVTHAIHTFPGGDSTGAACPP